MGRGGGNLNRTNSTGGFNSLNNINPHDVVNFSLNYRHVPENNPEGLSLHMVLHLKVAEKKVIRVLIYEKDNIKEVVHRLASYIANH